MKIIDGKKIADQILEQVKIKAQASKYILAIVNASGDQASKVYIRMKSQKAQEVGIDTKVIELPESTTYDEIVNTIRGLNDDSAIGGIILQMPLYPHLQDHAWDLASLISPAKDVDCLSAINQGRLSQGDKNVFMPATVSAIMYSLNYVSNDGEFTTRFDKLAGFLKGKAVTVINHSNLIGKPLAALLLNYNVTVTVAHQFTNNLESLTKVSDIVITATGQTNLLNAEIFKQDAIVIDCTSVRKEDGKTYGDVIVSSELETKLGWLTPVPGGIGPMTIACLLENLTKSGTER